MPLRYHLNALTAVRNEDTHGQRVPTPTRARVDIGTASTYVLETYSFARVVTYRGLALLDRPFPSPRLALPPFLLRGYPMPSTRYEACLITRSVHGPIELPSCRRSPSPLSRSPLESVRPSSHPFPFAPPQASVLDPFQRSILSDEIAIDSAFVYRKRKCATSIA